MGRTVLYWWPEDGWQRGRWHRRGVARLCPRGAFSHVVAYTRQTSALRGMEDTLLDAASYGVRWVLLSPPPGAGPPTRRLRRARSSGPPTLTFSLVGGSSQPGPAARPGSEAAAEIVISLQNMMFCDSFCGLSG